MVLSLAFVPLGDVVSAFEELLASAPDELAPVLDYFDTCISELSFHSVNE